MLCRRKAAWGTLMHSMLRRAIGPAAFWLAAAAAAHAQQQLPPLGPHRPNSSHPSSSSPRRRPSLAASGQVSQGNPVCARLETQLQTFDRAAGDGGRAEQAAKFEAAAANQQSELDRQEATAQRLGCGERNFFSLFGGGNSQQCGPLNSKINQMRNNLDRINADLERLRDDRGPEREAQRRAISRARCRRTIAARSIAPRSQPLHRRAAAACSSRCSARAPAAVAT